MLFSVKRIFTFLIALTIYTATQAQKPEFKFSHLQEGLSNVLAIHQDSFGFMWFGTKNGLSRYDGYSLHTYENNPKVANSIKANWVTSIVEDSQGNLYVGTFGGGLNIFNRKTNTFSALTSDDFGSTSGLPSNVVVALHYASDEEILIGTSKGFCVLNSLSGEVKHYDSKKWGLSNEYIASLTKGPDGGYWLGTENGLHAILPKSDKALIFSSQTHKGFKGKQVRSLCFDSDQALWAGTSFGGLNRIKKQGDQYQIKAYPMQKDATGTSGLAILSLLEDSQGRLWIGTEGGGLNLFNRNTQEFTYYENDPNNPQSISNYSIWSLAEDDAGIIWCGTYNKGISKIDPYYYKFNQLKRNINAGNNSLNNDIVNSFYEDEKGNLWIGTDGGGLNIYSPQSGRYIHYPPSQAPKGLGSRAVLAMEEAIDGRVWLGTWAGGINIANGQANSLKFEKLFPKLHFFSIELGKNGEMWAGSWGDGLFVLDEKGEEQMRFMDGEAQAGGLTNEHIIHVLRDSKERIWVCTLIGLNMIEKEGGAWKVTHFLKDFDNPGSLSSNTVLFTFEDSQGQIWIGTEDGLNRFVESDQSFEKLYRSDGLSGSGIKAILEDEEGDLWITTNQGLSKYDPQSQKLQNYGQSDGLLVNDFNARAAFKSNTGNYYFGSTEGLVYFKPQEVISNPNPPKVYITDLKLFNKSVEIGEDSPLKASILYTKKIALKPEQSVFSLDFVALNYTHAENNQYAYRLKGLETDWNYVGDHRFASYSNLDAGSYTFEVKASNNDGLWNEEPKVLYIEVLPAWHDLWFVKTLTALIIIASAIAFYLIRVSILKKQKRVLRKQIHDRTKEVTQKKEEIELQAEKLREINLSLEQKVAARTEDLAEALAELNHFTYHAAHDLKGPLARLLGLCYLGKLEVEDPKAVEYFSRLERTGNNMNSLLSKLMRVQEMKTKEIELASLQIGALIRKVFQQMNIAEVKEEVSLDLYIDTANSLMIDTVLIQTMLESLIKNAIDFRQVGIKAQISISCVQSQSYLEIIIKNNGVGIEQEVVEEVFNMFVKGNEKSRGLGLGLYEARIITKKLGGTIELINPSVGNTVFKIDLPLQ